jgi:hypothetical protein
LRAIATVTRGQVIVDPIAITATNPLKVLSKFCIEATFDIRLPVFVHTGLRL